MNIHLICISRFGNVLIDIIDHIYQYLILQDCQYINFYLDQPQDIVNFCNTLFDNTYIKFYRHNSNDNIQYQKTTTCFFYIVNNFNQERQNCLSTDKINKVLKYFQLDRLIEENKDLYDKVKNSLVIHLRLGDYTYLSQIKVGYQILTKNFIVRNSLEILSKYNMSSYPIYLVSDDRNKSKEILEDFNVTILEGNMYKDWLTLLFSKVVLASTSTYSLLAGILGCAQKVYIPYPYIVSNDTNFVKRHEFLYNNDKIIKCKL